MNRQISTLTLDELKQSLISDLQERVDDKILEPSNFNLLQKLINNAENKTEAISIATLGTTYKDKIRNSLCIHSPRSLASSFFQLSIFSKINIAMRGI